MRYQLTTTHYNERIIHTKDFTLAEFFQLVEDIEKMLKESETFSLVAKCTNVDPAETIVLKVTKE